MPFRKPRDDRDRLTKRLTEIRELVAGLEEQLGVLREQIVFLQQVEGEAQTDAVIDETGLARREHRAAHSDLQRAIRQRDEVQRARAVLLTEQDTLLEQLLPGDPARSADHDPPEHG